MSKMECEIFIAGIIFILSSTEPRQIIEIELNTMKQVQSLELMYGC